MFVCAMGVEENKKLAFVNVFKNTYISRIHTDFKLDFSNVMVMMLGNLVHPYIQSTICSL